MLITSSSGCGLKQITLLRLAAGRVIFDRVHHPAKDAMRHALRRAVVPQQLVQVVLAKVFVVSFSSALPVFSLSHSRPA